MNPLKKIDMMEATRLTREGRLKDAMDLLFRTSAISQGTSGNRFATATFELLPPRIGRIGQRKSQLNQDGVADSQTSERKPQISGPLGGMLDHSRQFGPASGMDVLSRGAILRTSVPDGARFEERTYANAAGSRTYKLFVPSGYIENPVPLVVMLHGCKQSPDDFAVGTRMNQLAEEQTFLVAYPAQSTAANPSRCWNWFKALDQERDQGEPSLIAGITREIMSDFEVEPGRVFIAGLSAGGAAAAILGTSYPELFAAVGVHSGLACGAALDMPSAFAAMRTGARAELDRPGAVRIIVFHGDRDMTVNSVNGDQVIAQSKSADNLRNCPVLC